MRRRSLAARSAGAIVPAAGLGGAGEGTVVLFRIVGDEHEVDARRQGFAGDAADAQASTAPMFRSSVTRRPS